MDENARARRAALPGGISKLGEEDVSPAPPHATPSELVAMVWRLTLDAWAFTGKHLPSYERQEMPGRIVRRHDPGAE